VDLGLQFLELLQSGIHLILLLKPLGHEHVLVHFAFGLGDVQIFRPVLVVEVVELFGALSLGVACKLRKLFHLSVAVALVYFVWILLFFLSKSFGLALV